MEKDLGNHLHFELSINNQMVNPLYVSGDFKYHDFFKSYSGTLLVDIGHYEGEFFIKNIIFHLLKEKFSTFATLMSKVEKLEVNYF